MAKMDTVLTGAGSFASELVGLVRDLRIGLRAQMERTFPGVPFTPGPAFHWPRVKDDESFVTGVAEARRGGQTASARPPRRSSRSSISSKTTSRASRTRRRGAVALRSCANPVRAGTARTSRSTAERRRTTCRRYSPMRQRCTSRCSGPSGTSNSSTNVRRIPATIPRPAHTRGILAGATRRTAAATTMLAAS